MSMRSALILSLLASGLAACDGGGGEDAGAGDGSSGDGSVARTCSTVHSLMGVLDDSVSVTFDTTMTEERPRDLGPDCGNTADTARWAPQEVVELTVPGSPDTTYSVAFRTNLPGTDENFNTVVQVRDSCETIPPSNFPPRCFDDIAADEFRSEGAITVPGGTVLYFIVTGYSEPPADQMTVDSGVVQIDFFIRESTPPTLTDGYLRLAGEDARVEVHGNDPNADVRGVAMNFYDSRGLLDIFGDGEATEDGDVLVVRFDDPVATGFDYTGGAWLRGADVGLAAFLRRAGATRVRLRAYDAAWGLSEPLDVDITEAMLAGLGEACDDMVFCRPEMVCSSGVCLPNSQLASLCDTASEIPIASDPRTAVTVTQMGTTGAGAGYVATPTDCVADPRGGAGAETVYKVDVSIPSFDLIVTTDLPGTVSTNTILYVRGECPDSGTLLACNDDIDAMGMNQRSRVELRDQTAMTYYVFVESYGGLMMGTAPHEVGVTVRPLIPSGMPCDMAAEENRCQSGTCTGGVCP